MRDLRHLTTAEDIFAAIVEHIQQATNGGNIRSTISIFAPDSPGVPGIRIWNPQLIRYAGYRQANGSIVGDPAQAELTECQHFGWQGQGTQFDILPLIIQMPGQKPQLFEIPRLSCDGSPDDASANTTGLQNSDSNGTPFLPFQTGD